MRIWLFVDHSNLALDTDRFTKDQNQIDIGFDWTKLRTVLVREIASLVDDDAIPIYEGMNVYASCAPHGYHEERKRDWLLNQLDEEPRVHVELFIRKASRERDDQLDGGTRPQFKEKGLDCRLSLDMIAKAKSYDVAAIVSSDTDFERRSMMLQH